MEKKKQSLEDEQMLSKDEQINCLTHLIYALVGYGAALKMIENVKRQYLENRDALHSEA